MKRHKRFSSVATLAVAAAILLVTSILGGAASSLVGHAAAAGGVGTASAKGIYAFSLSTHDPRTSQEGAGVGTLVFDGMGNVSGTISETERFPTDCACGDLVVPHAPYAGTYVVRSDGSTTLDICINNPSTTVRAIFEGAFSNAFHNLRLVLTEFTAPCVGGTLEQVPNITSGTADKL